MNVDDSVAVGPHGVEELLMVDEIADGALDDLSSRTRQLRPERCARRMISEEVDAEGGDHKVTIGPGAP